MREALTDAVEFLTEDSVSFTFAAGDFRPMREPFLRFDPTGPVFDAQDVILFSGGLDSFAGTLEVLSTTSDKVLLLSHRSAQKVIPRQEKLGEYLSDRFEGRVQHLQVNARRRGAEGKETTQRSRSLLFAALGRAVGQSLGIKRVSFYENGVVSQNLPIFPQVVGTMATRTTHPLALLKLNEAFDLMGEGGIRIENRYAWLTKTDIVRRIEQHGGKEQIGTAVSCTIVRDQTKLHTHCGACSQCLDRRFAILAAGLEKHDPVESYAVDVLTGERQTRQSITMAMEWTRHGLRLRQLDERGLFNAFGLELTRILKGHPELSPSEALTRTRQLQHRHSEQLRGALERAVQEHAAELVGNSLPATSLLVLHVTGGSGVTPGISEDPRLHVPAHQETGPISEVDLNPDPDAPLVISFFTEGSVAVIAARGLGRVEGPPAQVAHDLKPAFDRAIQEGLRREQHPYIRPHEILRDKDLPAGVNILRDFAGGSDEGRAMAQLLYDVAPGVDFAYHIALEGASRFADGIMALSDVIVDDIGYLLEPYFQDGQIAQAAEDAALIDGIPFFSSAGNDANKTYETAYNFISKVDAGFSETDFGGYRGFHDFNPAAGEDNVDIVFDFVLQSGDSFFPILQWATPFASAGG